MLNSKLIIENVLISRIFITNSIQIKCNKKLFHAISDDISEAIDNVAKKTNAEIDSIENDKKNYCYHVDYDICSHLKAAP